MNRMIGIRRKFCFKLSKVYSYSTRKVNLISDVEYLVYLNKSIMMILTSFSNVFSYLCCYFLSLSLCDLYYILNNILKLKTVCRNNQQLFVQNSVNKNKKQKETKFNFSLRL